MRNFFMKTERIGFSIWEQEDIDLAKSLWNDPQVTRFLCASGVFTEQDILQRLDREIDNQAQYSIQYWPIFLLEDGDLIGCCGLRCYDMEKKIYEIGFHLRPKYWGHGLGSEAAKAVINYAFSQLGASDLFAGHNPNNLNSRKILERLGFHYIGDEFYEPTGLYHPSYRYLTGQAE